MKKLALSSLLAATILSANNYNYELTPVIGKVITEGNLGIEDHTVYGAQMQFNNLGTLLMPELSVLYSNADFENNMGDSDIYRIALNGVYEYATDAKIIPFAKMGLGYEYLDKHTFDNHNSAFADAGAGVKIPLMDQLALKLEALYMLKFNDSNWDSNLALLAGLNFAFGEKAQPVAPVVAAVAAPIVAAVAAPEPAPAPKPVAVPAPAPKPVVVAAPIDSDKDGVFDPQDKCPETPAGFKVDADGCPLKATLHLNFATDSNKVDAEGTEKVAAFASFLKDSPAYNASIVGHTDSTASDVYNQKLSEKRAEMVRSMLVKEGVEASRLSASGKGESQPVATNKTKQGRAENRRIEVELSH